MPIINFDLCPACYWPTKEKIEYLQRKILVHSILYYRANKPCISDEVFDELSLQLVDMQKEHKQETKQTKFYYCFKSFDGSTGFDLIRKLKKEDKSQLFKIANLVLYCKKENSK